MATKSQHWMAGFGVMLLVITLVLAAVDRVVARSDLTINEIRYKGHFNRVNVRSVEKLVLDNIQGNLLTTDIHELEDLIVYLPWVKRAHIRRDWPDALEILIEELQPIARVNEHKILVANGALYDNPHDDQDTGLIEITLDESMFEVQKDEIFAVLKRIDAMPFKVYQLVVSPRGAITLMLGFNDQDLEVVLGSKNIEKRLARFADIWERDLKQNLGTIHKVDMRYENGFVVQMRESAVERG